MTHARIGVVDARNRAPGCPPALAREAERLGADAPWRDLLEALRAG